jgi:hypothetical protein
MTIAVFGMGATLEVHAAKSAGTRLIVSATVVDTCYLDLPTGKPSAPVARASACRVTQTNTATETNPELLLRAVFTTEVNDQLGVITLIF